MSLNDDHLRLLSDAEREAMEDDDKYDPDTDNAAALAALGHDGGPRGEAARQCRVRAHRRQRSVHRVQRAQRESRAPGDGHGHGRHGAGQVHGGRDLQGAMLQLSTTPLAGKQAEVFRNIRRNTRSFYKDLRRERREESAGTSEWAKLWEHLQLDGGTTRYRDLHADPKDCAKALHRALDQVGEGKVVGNGRALLAWLPGSHETLEATTRLGVYKAALDQGISRQEASSIAKNITVNFNRKGRNMPVAGTHFAFLNAAIQGNKRMLETLAGPAGRKVMMGGALGMVSAMAVYLMMAEAKGRVERGEDADAVLLDVPLAQLRGSAGLVDEQISDW
ncbi:hypothetical protein [Delftia acidovorans]|uniref:hypothetical protein n=1 Tax=Delftia acidovorans TaxID=80866 RepID=UPI0035A1CE7D